MKSPGERREEARQQKLEEIQEQVDAGGLVIRPMTDAERKRFPKKPEGSGGRSGRRAGGGGKSRG